MASHRSPGFGVLVFFVVVYYWFVRDPAGEKGYLESLSSIHPVFHMGSQYVRLKKVLNNRVRDIIQHKKYRRKISNITSVDLVSNKVLVCNMKSPAGEYVLTNLIKEYASQNKYLVYGGRPFEKVSSFSRRQKYELAKLLCHPGAPQSIFTRRRMFFVDFHSFGCSPFYISMIADPVTEFVSAYKQHWKYMKIKSSVEDSLAVCVTNNDEECLYSGTVPKNSFGRDEFRYVGTIPYFCGDSELCRNLAHPRALQQAKANIESKFMVVGAMEMWMEFKAVLQCKLPKYFRGIGQNKMLDFNPTILPDNILEDLKKRLEPEYKLYEFIRERLANQHRECL